MKAILVGISNYVEVEDVEELTALIVGRTEDLSEYRAKGAMCHRAELDNQPELKGFLGPMWDGGRLRYETQEAYDMYSR